MISHQPDEFTIGQWHLLLCKPNQSHIAFRNLKRLGLELFMPRHTVERRWRGRVTQAHRPIFGGYLFASMTPACKGWHEVKKAPGVASLIGFSSAGPALVPAAVVTGLMERCDKDGLLRTQDDFVIGDEVKMTRGPFAEFVTTIESISPDRRLHVLLSLLGRPTKLDVDPSIVMRCN